MLLSLEKFYIKFSLVLVTVFVSAVSLIFNGSSMLIGIALILLSIYFLNLHYGMRIKIPLSIFVKFYLISLLIFFTSSTALISFEEFNFQRFLFSYLFLTFMFFSAIVFYEKFYYKLNNKDFSEALNYSLFILVVVAIVSIVLQKNNYVTRKSMIIFSEPSHFALVYLPFLLYFLISKNPNVIKIFIIVFSFFLALMVENLTLLVGVVFSLVLFLMISSAKKILFFTPFIILLFFLMISLDLTYFSERLEFSSSTSNLSTLVFMSGWQEAYSSLIATNGLGLGFQQLGVVNQPGEIQKIIIEIMQNEAGLNRFDGGSLAPKIIAENGYIGIVLLLFYIYGAFKVIKFLREENKSVFDLFFGSVYLMFSMELFVRGMGYFSVLSFIFLMSLFWLHRLRNKK